ncbi:hypothetical protein HK104_001146 [Borealophlyctis nickersoniae]|nr:hypothetical protein HK104_001146 [Borealophlyctis nickersoniae]
MGNKQQLVPEHLQNIVDSTDTVQERVFLCSLEASALPASGSEPPRDPSSALQSETPRAKKRRAAVEKIKHAGANEYLQTLGLPISISLPAIPWSYLGSTKRTAPADIGLVTALQQNDKDKAATIVSERHAMIVAWVEVLMVLYRQGHVPIEMIKMAVEEMRSLSREEGKVIEEVYEYVREEFWEAYVDEKGKPYEIFVRFSIHLLIERGVPGEVIKRAVDDRVVLKASRSWSGAQ